MERLAEVKELVLSKEMLSSFALATPTNPLTNSQQIINYIDPTAAYQVIPSIPLHETEQLFDTDPIVADLLPSTKNCLLDIALPLFYKEVSHFGRFLLFREKLIGIRLRTSPDWKRYRVEFIDSPLKKKKRIPIGDFILNFSNCKIALLFSSQLEEAQVLSEHLQYGCELFSVVNDIPQGTIAHNISLAGQSIKKLKQFVQRSNVIGMYSGVNTNSFIEQPNVCSIRTAAHSSINQLVIQATCDLGRTKQLKRQRALPSNPTSIFCLDIYESLSTMRLHGRNKVEVPEEKIKVLHDQKCVQAKSLDAQILKNEPKTVHSLAKTSFDDSQCSGCLIMDRIPINIRIECTKCGNILCYQCERDRKKSAELKNWTCQSCDSTSKFAAKRQSYGCQTDLQSGKKTMKTKHHYQHDRYEQETEPCLPREQKSSSRNRSAFDEFLNLRDQRHPLLNEGRELYRKKNKEKLKERSDGRYDGGYNTKYDNESKEEDSQKFHLYQPSPSPRAQLAKRESILSMGSNYDGADINIDY